MHLFFHGKAKEKRGKFLQNGFSHGLNGTYSAIRGYVLMKPIPPINEIFQLLIQEEKQRIVGSHVRNHTEQLAMSARITPPFKYYTERDMKCSYCQKMEHMKDNCYKLHGFPPGFKFRDKRDNKERKRAPHYRSAHQATHTPLVQSPFDQFDGHTSNENGHMNSRVESVCIQLAHGAQIGSSGSSNSTPHMGFSPHHGQHGAQIGSSGSSNSTPHMGFSPHHGQHGYSNLAFTNMAGTTKFPSGMTLKMSYVFQVLGLIWCQLVN